MSILDQCGVRWRQETPRIDIRKGCIIYSYTAPWPDPPGPCHLDLCPVGAYIPIPFEYPPTPTCGSKNLDLGAWKAAASHILAKSEV